MDPNSTLDMLNIGITAAVGATGVLVGAWVAYKWGDIAAEQQRQRYEIQQRRIATLGALGTIEMETERALEYCRLNQELNASTAERYRLLPLPTRVFTSIFIDHYGEFDFSPDLIDAVIGYLAGAERVNTMIELSRRAMGSGEADEQRKANRAATLASEWHAETCSHLAQIRTHASANRASLRPDTAIDTSGAA